MQMARLLSLTVPLSSNTTLATPCRASSSAAVSPTGPAPMMATR